MDQLNLVILKNPFKPETREIKQVSYVPGLSVYEYLQPYLMGMDEDDIVVAGNGRIFDSEELFTIIPDPGDYIAMSASIGKRGGGKQILATILSIGLYAYAGGIVDPKTGWAAGSAATRTANAFWSTFAAMGVVMIGGALISHLCPMPETDTSSTTTTYGWAGPQSLQGQGGPVSITYGSMRTGGTLIGQHVTYEGENQYLHLLYSGGQGPIDEINPDDILIDGNPLDHYSDVAYEIKMGTNDQTPVSFFTKTYADQTLSYELGAIKHSNGAYVDTSWSSQSTEGNAGTGLEAVIDFPQGLFRVNDDGGNDSISVVIELQYRIENGTWQEWVYETVNECKDYDFNRVYTLSGLTPGRYEVRARCLGKSSYDTRTSHKVVWTSLTHIIDDTLCRPGKILIGLRILANSQLSNSYPTVTWIQTRNNVLIYNPVTQVHEYKSARNPAWISYDMYHQCRRLTDIRTNQSVDVVFGLSSSKFIYEEFSAWATRCDEDVDGQPRIQFEYIFDSFNDLWSQLKIVEAVGRGKVLMRGTRIGCIFDGAADPVQLFTVGNIVQSSYSGKFLGIKDIANAVEVTFINKDKGYQKDTVTIYGENWDSSDSVENPTQIDLTACVPLQQAIREGRYRLNVSKLPRILTFDADIDAITSRLGDVVLVQYDVPGWDDLGGRIISATHNTVTLDRQVTLRKGVQYAIMTRLLDDTRVIKQVYGNDNDDPIVTDTVTTMTDFEILPEKWDLYAFGDVNTYAKPYRISSISKSVELKRRVTVVQYDETVYADGGEYPNLVVYGNNPPKPIVAQVRNLSVSEHARDAGNGQYANEVTIQFTGAGQDYRNASVYIKSSNPAWDEIDVAFEDLDSSFERFGQDLTTYRFVGNAINELWFSNLRQGITYTFKVVANNQLGVSANFDLAPEASITISGRSYIPIKPSNFRVTITNQFVWEWDQPTNPDVDFAELRTDQNCGNNVGLLVQTPATKATVTPPTRSGTLYLYFHNTTGIYSAAAPLAYSKPQPSAPQNLTVTSLFQALKVTCDAVPTNCLGVNFHVNDEIDFSNNNSYVFQTTSGSYTIRAAYVDMFGEGQLCGAIMKSVIPQITPELLQGEAISLEHVDQVIQDAIAQAQASASEASLESLQQTVIDNNDNLISQINNAGDKITAIVTELGKNPNALVTGLTYISVTSNQVTVSMDALYPHANDYYNNMYLFLTNGTGAGQRAKITDSWYNSDLNNGALVSYTFQVDDTSNTFIKYIGSSSLFKVVVDPPAYSALTMLNDGINLKVDKANAVSQINMTPETIRLASKLIHISGDTLFDDNVIVGKMLSADCISANNIEANAIQTQHLTGVLNISATPPTENLNPMETLWFNTSARLIYYYAGVDSNNQPIWKGFGAVAPAPTA